MPVTSQVVGVSLAGCGAVGSALVSLLRSAPAVDGRPVRVTRVLVRRPFQVRPVYPRSVTLDLGEFLEGGAGVVVEAIGDVEPALTIARHVLGRGGVLVTANKELVAGHGPELEAMARESGGWFGFGAAVGGGVPVIRMLRQSLPPTGATVIRGVLNGTSNFVLTRLEEGVSLTRALAEARERGLAEADPSRDLDGRDVAAKLAILCWVAWGIAPRDVAVHRQGLLPDLEARVHEAARLGGRLRLVGECRRTPDGVIARVRPEVVAPDSAAGRIRLEGNLVEVETGWGLPLVLAGPGAGGAPTATALWADLREGLLRTGVTSR